MICVSFHSYKGGSCRTSTAMNIIPFLVEKLKACKDRPILLIDSDIDSAGLTYFLNEEKNFEGTFDSKKLLGEILPGRNIEIDEKPLSEHPFFSKCTSIGNRFGVEKEAVLFLGVDVTSNFDSDKKIGVVDSYTRSFRQLCENYNIKAVVFDTASGEQFSAQVTTKMSNTIVCCLRPTIQHRKGTFRYLDKFKSEMAGSDRSKTKRIIILPTAVPLGQSDASREKKERALKLIAEDAKLSDQVIDTTFISMINCFGIPEVERFKWDEDILYKISESELSSDEKEALNQYKFLAESIVGE